MPLEHSLGLSSFCVPLEHSLGLSSFCVPLEHSLGLSSFCIFGILNFRKVELCAFGTQFGPFIFLYDFSLLADVIIHKW